MIAGRILSDRRVHSLALVGSVGRAMDRKKPSPVTFLVVSFTCPIARASSSRPPKISEDNSPGRSIIMNLKPGWLAATALVALLAGETVFACHNCKQTPCVLAPPCEPAYECVTEMVPFTVMKTKTRVDLVPVCTKTVMEKKIDIEYDVQTRDGLQARLRHGAPDPVRHGLPPRLRDHPGLPAVHASAGPSPRPGRSPSIAESRSRSW